MKNTKLRLSVWGIVLCALVGPWSSMLSGAAPQALEEVAYLGVATRSIDAALTAHLGLPRGIGLIVEYVDADSPAAGMLQEHDVLHKLNEQLLISPHQFAVLVRTFRPDTEITITFFRGGNEQVVKARLVARELPRLHEPGMPGPQINLAPPFGGSFTNFPGLQELHRQMMQQFPRMNGQFFREADADQEEDGNFKERISVQSSVSQSVVTMTSGDDVVSMTTDTDGSRTLMVMDAEGKVTFEGPVDTDEQIAGIPQDVSETYESLKKMTQGMRIKLPNPAPANETM